MASVKTNLGKPKSRIANLLVIGGGAAAFAASTRAADDGVKVTMVNAGLPLGGTCVNVGCMPSKMLLDAAKSYKNALDGRDGWLQSTGRLDFPLVMRAKERMVQSARTQNYHDVIQALGNVSLVEGRAKFTGPKEIAVNGERFSGDAVLIATGARTCIPEIPGLREAKPLTNITALDLEAIPERMGVIGGGPLGLEWAQIFARLGRGRVELIGCILPRYEPEAQEEIARRLAEDDAVRVHAGHRLAKVEGKPGNIRLTDDHGDVIEVDQVLAATGIQPNTDGLGLERAGVALDEHGFVIVNDRGETNAPGVYAAGDVTGKRPLETVAAKMGYLAAHNAITGEARAIDYDQVPEAVFTDPQVAMVGWTEERMMRELGKCDCRRIPMEWVPKAHAIGDTRGLAKLVAHPETRKILGATAVGVNAADIIHIPTLAMKAGMTLDDLLEVVHVFPTMSEVWKMAAHAFTRDPETMSCCIV